MRSAYIPPRIRAPARALAMMLALGCAAMPSHASPSENSVGAGDAEAQRRAERLVDGVVRAVDRANRLVVLRHGAIENLGIPPMTTRFRLSDSRALDQLDAGAAVRFAADRVGGVFMIIHIERRGGAAGAGEERIQRDE